MYVFISLPVHHFHSLDGTDFIGISAPFSFEQGSVDGTRVYVNISITNDECFEQLEFFSASVSSDATNVMILKGTVDIHIHDDDSECHKMHQMQHVVDTL
jgi:hypothetical protein